MKKRILAIMLTVCMVVVLMPTVALAAEDVTITGNSGWWGRMLTGSYVEYTMDGVAYNSQTAPSAINRQAWSRMDQAQKHIMYAALHGNARREQMGIDGDKEMLDWYRATNQWFVANKEWQTRIAKRDYPDLQTFFVENTLSTLSSDYDTMVAHLIPQALRETAEARAYAAALADVQYTWELGTQYYAQAVSMRAKGIAAVTSYTVVQCTAMLSDMLFIPAVAQMAAGKFSSEAADFINTLLQAVGEENESTAEKIRKYRDGDTTVELDSIDQVVMYAAAMDTNAEFARQARHALPDCMNTLRTAYTNLVTAQSEYSDEQAATETAREQAARAKEQAIETAFAEEALSEPESGDDECIYGGLSFRWKTAQALYALYHGEDEALFEANVQADVAAQYAALEAEAADYAVQLAQAFNAAYSAADTAMTAQEQSRRALYNSEDWVNRERYYRLIDEYDSFDNNSTVLDFQEALLTKDIDAYDQMISEYLGMLTDGIEALGVVSEDTQAMIDGMDSFDTTFSLLSEELYGLNCQIDELLSDYHDLRGSMVYRPRETESSSPYPFAPPSGLTPTTETALHDALLPALQGDRAEVITSMTEARPRALYRGVNQFYQDVQDTLDMLHLTFEVDASALTQYRADREALFAKLEQSWQSYVTAGRQLADCYAAIWNEGEDFKALWPAAYFYNELNNFSYTYDGMGISLTEFNIPALKAYIKGGGDKTTVLNHVNALVKKGEQCYMAVREASAAASRLKLEMSALLNDYLKTYAAYRGYDWPAHHYGAIWDNSSFASVGTGSEGVILYSNYVNGSFFDAYDAAYIRDVLMNQTEKLVFIRQGYADAQAYNAAHSSSAQALRVLRAADTGFDDRRAYDVYSAAYSLQNTYNNQGQTLMSQAELNSIRSGLLFGTQREVMNTGLSYLYPISTHSGVNSTNPIGSWHIEQTGYDTAILTIPVIYGMVKDFSSVTVQCYTSEDAPTIGAGTADPETETIRVPISGLIAGQQYNFHTVNIQYNDIYSGLVRKESGNPCWYTHAARQEVTIQAEFPKDADGFADYNRVNVTVTNHSGETLREQYIRLVCFDAAGEETGSAVSPLGTLENNSESGVITIPLSEPSCSVSASVLPPDAIESVRMTLISGKLTGSIAALAEFGDCDVTAMVAIYSNGRLLNVFRKEVAVSGGLIILDNLQIPCAATDGLSGKLFLLSPSDFTPLQAAIDIELRTGA